MAVGPVATIGDVLLDMVEADNPIRTYDVSDRAVENGSNISDHMKERPLKLSISGVIVGPDAWPRLARIIGYQNNRELVTYTNRVIHTNMAIININTEHGVNIGNGLKFKIQMKHARHAVAQQAQTTVSPAVATKAKETGNAGIQQSRETNKQANNKEADIRLKAKLNYFFNIAIIGEMA